MHEKKEEQKYPQNETEDGRRSSTSPSHPASPVRCSHRPGACDPGRTPGHVRVNEVGKGEVGKLMSRHTCTVHVPSTHIQIFFLPNLLESKSRR